MEFNTWMLLALMAAAVILAGVTTALSARKRLRTRLAQAEGVPAYIIFSNATLADMAVKLPTTMEGLLEVSGVGSVKAARYGAAFLDVIREYLEI